jgi:hypothetical protein
MAIASLSTFHAFSSNVSCVQCMPDAILPVVLVYYATYSDDKKQSEGNKHLFNFKIAQNN